MSSVSLGSVIRPMWGRARGWRRSNLRTRLRQKARVLISNSRKDIAFVDRLDAALKARGFEPLIDRSEIYAFEDWWNRIG